MNSDIELAHAIEALTGFQQQLDSDGVYIGVSRQALDIVLEATRRKDAKIARLLEALAPSAETKAAYMSEFSFSLTRVDDYGNEYLTKPCVPWTTVKEIMAAIRARAALKEQPNGQ